MLRRLTALASVLALLSCAGGEAKPLRKVQAPLKIQSRAPHDVEKTVMAEISMTIAGDENITLEKRSMKLHIVEIFGPTLPQITHFFSVSSAETVKVGRDRLLFTADLAPGSYQGYPGTYTISRKGVPPIPGRTNSIGGAAYVWVLHPKPEPIPKFDELVEPCTLVIADGALDGSVDCPRLSTSGGPKKSVSLRWSWKVL